MPLERIKSAIADRANRHQEAVVDYENADERPLDDLKTDVTEILGEPSKRLFRNPSRDAADVLEARAQRAEEKADKVTTREKYLDFRKNATINKINRIQRRMDNSGDGFFSKQINRQRRQSIEILGRKKDVLGGQRASIENKRKEKPEEIRKQIDKLVDKKIRSMERKARRIVAHREKGIRLNQVAKRSEFLAKATPEDRKKIVREAILQVRRENIKKGLINSSHEADETSEIRKIGNGDGYGRAA